MVWIFVSHPAQNSYVEILTLKGDALSSCTFGRWLGHKVGALMNGISDLMNGISDLIKEIPQRFLVLVYHARTQWEGAGYESGRGPLFNHAGTTTLASCPQNSEIEISVVYKLPRAWWHFVKAAQTDQDNIFWKARHVEREIAKLKNHVHEIKKGFTKPQAFM